MKPLIRPFLFIAVRLGLFLSVLVWIVGQSRTISMHCPVGEFTFLSQGWAIAFYSGLPWNFFVNESDPESTQWVFEDLSENDPSVPPSLRGGVTAGVTVMYSDRIILLAVRHWQIVAAFLVVYGVLKFVYRRIPDRERSEA